MSANALESQGTILYLGGSAGSSPADFTEIEEVISITGPSGTANVIDVSDLRSSRREKRAGLADNGNISFEIFYIPTNTQHAALRTMYGTRVGRQFQIEFTDSPATVWQFEGYVTGFSASTSVDNVWKATITVEINGDITES
jgi:hypothetical protein